MCCLAESIFYWIDVSIFFTGNVTRKLFSSSHGGSQIMLPLRKGRFFIRFREASTKGKETLMRKTKFTAGLLAFSLLLAASAIAGNANKGTLQVDETVTVGGKQLRAGKYRVEWTESGSNTEVSISDGKETIVKVPAQVLPLKRAEATNGYGTTADQAGNKALTEIFFGGKKYELSIGEASAATATSSDQTRGSN